MGREGNTDGQEGVFWVHCLVFLPFIYTLSSLGYVSSTRVVEFGGGRVSFGAIQSYNDSTEISHYTRTC